MPAHPKVGQCKQRLELQRVFLQTPVAHFDKSKLALDDAKLPNGDVGRKVACPPAHERPRFYAVSGYLARAEDIGCVAWHTNTLSITTG